MAVATGLTAASPAALAHVKWFSRDVDCAMPPLSPLTVIAAPDFLLLFVVSVVAMVLATALDVRMSRAGSRSMVWAVRVDRNVTVWMPALLRYALAAFFCVAVLYFGAQPVYLTPELHAVASWVTPLQCFIAVAMLRRSSAWIGAVGIAALYVAAVASYGWFHLLDYPVFLGAAAFVAIDSLGEGRRTDLALAVLRITAGVTLMWAGAEKWLYPWWADDVLDNQLRAARGPFSPEFFMVAAGFVEFCAAYALVFGRLGVQVASWVLLVPFVAAVPIFGELDAIGHAPIVVVLIMLGLTRSRLPGWMQGASEPSAAWRRALSCLLAALASIGLYGGLQAVAYPAGRIDPNTIVVAVLLCLPLLCWWLPRLRGLSLRRAPVETTVQVLVQAPLVARVQEAATEQTLSAVQVQPAVDAAGAARRTFGERAAMAWALARTVIAGLGQAGKALAAAALPLVRALLRTSAQACVAVVGAVLRATARPWGKSTHMRMPSFTAAPLLRPERLLAAFPAFALAFGAFVGAMLTVVIAYRLA